jgi:hypothetical protein
MPGKVSFFLSILLIIVSALIIFACSGSGLKTDPGEERRHITDKDFVTSIKRQVDDQVSWSDAIVDIEKVRGKIVRWSGDVVKLWNDRLLIASDAGDGGWNHFILLLDHPLSQATTVKDLIQTISSGDAIYTVGKIVDRKTIVLETGSDLTIPHLECYVISKENDRQFARPVWVKKNE